ncbi:hypothetical protein FRC04_006972 [Tulasnella sp. 424]|nr:hypothetical protein FRC04_006972 [Tulasnella sp. 424]KAG8966050.1 hypothetical protein FRC05_002891 [Tulasnella sp. 425]
MSYHGNGGHYGGGGGGSSKGRYSRRDRDQHYPPPERPETKLRNSIIKFADDPESDPAREIPRLASHVRDQLPASSAAVAEGLRIGCTEQPYKIPLYAALVAFLSAGSGEEVDDDAETGAQVAVRAVLEDFVKGFQGYVDELKWLQMKLCIQFFAHLVTLHVITPKSLLALLQSLTAVLDEPGVSYYRARCAALCAGEALLRAGGELSALDEVSVTQIIAILRVFAESQVGSIALVSPLVRLYEKNEDAAGHDDETRETVSSLVAALGAMQASSFANTPSALPRPQKYLPPLENKIATPLSLNAFDLPFVLVPPDAMDLEGDDGVGAAVGPSIEDGQPTPAAKLEVPSVYLRVFDDEVTPNDHTPSGYLVRSCVRDTLEIFEVNRKEAARILLDLPRWWNPSTFKRRHQDDDASPLPEGDIMEWNLDCLIIETTLSLSFQLPIAPHVPVYYYALITDLCKLSPSTVGPAVGKSIRKLYRLLEDTGSVDDGALDVEVARRFVEWFAVHMSNFNFNWVWKEWIPDLDLPRCHPRRRFIQRAIELEIRASYFDRIKETLPVEYHDPQAYALPEEAPGPDYEYDDPRHPHFAEAEALTDLIKARSKVDVVLVRAQELCAEAATRMSENDATTILRTVSVQVILHVGSRSFSHFLNAIERYLSLLKFFSKDTEAKAQILDTAAKFWRRNSQMIAIVFDKFMQYQVVDPADVVAWSFRSSATNGDHRVEGSIGIKGWEILKAALDKASGRVAIAKRKVQKVKKEEEDAKAKLKASKVVDDVMEEEVAMQDDTTESPALAAALKAHSTLTRDQKTALVRALDGFVSFLGSAPQSGVVITKDAWQSRNNWEDDPWDSWESWGWFRHFCRAYSSQLKTYMNTLEAVSIGRLDSTPGVDPAAADMVKAIWNSALGGE